MKLVWTKEALLRLKEIDEYISKDNPSTSIIFVDKLISLAETIVDNPKREELFLNFLLKISASYYLRTIG